MNRRLLVALLFAAAGCGTGEPRDRSGPDAPPHEVRLGDGADAPLATFTPPDGMVSVPASTQTIDGQAHGVAAFLADRTEVTNRAFAEFVAATGHRTDAERIGNSVVFVGGAFARGESVFQLVEGADWRHPTGPGSDIDGREEHPVVHVSFNDARAFAAWADKRLPTREEWFAMARGDDPEAPYPFGESLQEDGRWRANIWQGRFPREDVGLDGFVGTAPVASFAPGPFGIHDLGGNVWEWTAETSHGLPLGLAPGEAPAQALATVRGGSFLCRERAVEPFHACRGYRIGASEAKPLDDGNNQVGFRCVRSAR